MQNRASPSSASVLATRQQILCVESPSGLTDELPEALNCDGLEVRKFGDGVRALLGLYGSSPAAVLVPTDVMAVSLLTFVEAVARDSKVPVIVGFTQDVSSARSAFSALEAGACALLALPFDREALISTLRAIGRQRKGGRIPLEYGGIRLFRDQHEVYVGSAAVHLSPREFRIIEYLLSEAPRVVTAKEVGCLLQLGDTAPDAIRVRKHMQRLRYKLDAAQPGAGAHTLLATLKGVGYRLTATVPTGAESSDRNRES